MISRLSTLGALFLVAGAAAQATAPQYGQVCVILISYIRVTCTERSPPIVRRHRLDGCDDMPFGLVVPSLKPLLLSMSPGRGLERAHERTRKHERW